jgi:putative ABC transport system ATP-binding protein
VIKLNKVSKRFRTRELETLALDKVSVEVTKGEFVAVMGPSGCGKSTLLNVIAMIDNVSEGNYSLEGRDVSGLNERQLVDIRKHSIGFIFQSFNLIDGLSVYENVELPLLYQSIPQARRRARVREVLELVDLSSRARHTPAQLSGGQQQRVAVARAVVGDPKLLVADEPTGNLDTRNGDDVMELLSTLNEQGATIIMVTHSPAHARCAHRTINMLDGRIVPDLAGTL